MALICPALVRAWDTAGHHRATWPARVATCERLAGLADDAGPHVALTLALAYEETHYTAAPARLCGPLQVARRYHCPGCTHRECEAAGAALLARLVSEAEGSDRVALRRWLAGPRGLRGPLDPWRERWIGAVLVRAAAIERALARGGDET